MKKEQINDYKKENYNLKKIIGNYRIEFDNKNKLFNEIQTKINETENLSKKQNYDKKFLLSILLRILNLYPNSKMINLLNKTFNEDLNVKNDNDKDKLINIISSEIKLFENYIIELEGKGDKNC